jgi:arylsulfatase A-like enzyme
MAPRSLLLPLAALASSALARSASASSSSSAGAPPNFVFILTDDQDVEMDSLQYQPKLRSLVGEQGVTFNEMYASVPVCCPSRSSLYSGMFQHNNGVVGNSIPANCSSTTWQNVHETRSFAVSLQEAGYLTSFAGKYLNCYGFPAVGGVAHIPPGWTNWQGLVGNSIYYGYTLSNNGVAEKHGNDYLADYLPNLVLNKSIAFIESAAKTGKPFFAYLSPPAAHGPADPAPQYADLYPDVKAPRYPNYNASLPNVHWLQSVQGVYGLDENAGAFADLVYRRRLQTLATVDDIIESVVNTLQQLGVLDNTHIIYSTDNGYHTGEWGVRARVCGREPGENETDARVRASPNRVGKHRAQHPPSISLCPPLHFFLLAAGTFGFIYDKRQPWRTDTRLPLLWRGPGVPKNITSDSLVNMPDLSATFLDLAGVPIPAQFDGVSIRNALPGAQEQEGAAPPRLMTLIEYHGETADGGGGGPCARTSNTNLFCNPDGNYSWPPYFYGEPLCVCQDSANNTYNCLRIKNDTIDARYCEFNDSVHMVEYFDFTSDPYELNNLASTMDPAWKAALSARLAQAVECVGSKQCQAVLTAPITLAADSGLSLDALAAGGGGGGAALAAAAL